VIDLTHEVLFNNVTGSRKYLHTWVSIRHAHAVPWIDDRRITGGMSS
jgi:hypothetical protein